MKRILSQLKQIARRLTSPSSNIRSVDVGSPIEQGTILVETIPCGRSYFVWNCSEVAALRKRSMDDSLGYETVRDAIQGCEEVGLALLRYVEPEDLFFVFCQTLESLTHAVDSLLSLPAVSSSAPSFLPGVRKGSGGKEDKGQDKHKANPRAIVLCKVVYSENLQEFFPAEKKKGSGQTERYEITWPELQELKKSLGYAFDHSTSVKG